MILAILFRSYGFIAPKTLDYLAFQSLDFEPLPDEGYTRNVLGTLSLISMLLSDIFILGICEHHESE
jgi:hypothetical protein